VLQQAETAKRQSADEHLDSSHTVLVVEDEPGVLNLVAHTLSRRGFRVLEATDPELGATVFEEHAAEIDLLLTDVVMPFMSGPSLAELLRKKKPQLKVLFMSGHTENRVSFEQILENGVQFLPKPFTSDALIRKIRESLAGTGTEDRPTYSGGSN
jgi:two-component system, cell cycle sensor histidine kinase and response regulator CckA